METWTSDTPLGIDIRKSSSQPSLPSGSIRSSLGGVYPTHFLRRLATLLYPGPPAQPKNHLAKAELRNTTKCSEALKKWPKGGKGGNIFYSSFGYHGIGNFTCWHPGSGNEKMAKSTTSIQTKINQQKISDWWTCLLSSSLTTWHNWQAECLASNPFASYISPLLNMKSTRNESSPFLAQEMSTRKNGEELKFWKKMAHLRIQKR